jgi:hypothetical protein
MNQMHDIRDWLKGYLGAVEGASASGCSGSEQFVTACLSVTAWLGLVGGATRLVQHLLYF